MKSLGLIGAAIVLAASLASTASAGEISKSTLNSMGLSSMQLISDNDGLAVRGKGTYAAVYGYSAVNLGGAAVAYNSYNAASSKWYGSSFAVGASVSFGAVRGPFFGTAAISGGGAVAYAR